MPVPRRKTVQKKYAKTNKVSWFNPRKFALFRKIFLISLLFLGSLGFLLSYGVYKKINQNFASADSYKSFLPVDNHFPAFSYVVVDSLEGDPIKIEKVSFIILDRDSQKLVSYNIPLNLETEVPGKYSTEEFSKIFALGGLNSSDKLKGGTELLNLTMLRMFGFKSEGYILVDSSLKKDFDNLIYKGNSLITLDLKNLLNLKGSFKTDLELKTFYDINKFISSLPDDRFIQKEVSFSYLQSPQLIDDVLRDITISSPVSLEKKSIAVLNGSGVSNFAYLGARIVRNAGGRVVAIGNASQNYETTTLVVDDLNSETTRNLVHIFNIKNVLEKSEAGTITEQEIDRSDAVLILGFDLAEMLY